MQNGLGNAVERKLPMPSDDWNERWQIVLEIGQNYRLPFMTTTKSLCMSIIQE